LKHKASIKTPSFDSCLCGSGKATANCCMPYFEDANPAPTAEVLMRSRYVAYGLGLEPYLLATWHATTRPVSLDFDKDPPLNWIDLTIKRHELQGEDRAIVEFIARYKTNGRAHRLHETSRFVREEGRWFYIDGDIK